MPWSEVWLIDASPIWHVETTGIPPIQSAALRTGGEPRRREFEPWPGEQVRIAVTRPEPADAHRDSSDGAAHGTAPVWLPQSAARRIPARSPRVTNFVAILRLASSIISSPNITAPRRSSIVAFS